MKSKAVGISVSLHLATAALLGGLRSFPMPAPQVVMVDIVELGQGKEETAAVSMPAKKTRPQPVTPVPESAVADPSLPVQKKSENADSASTPQDLSGSSRSATASGSARILSLEEQYFASIRSEINKVKVYPPLARKLNQTGRVVIRFTINRDGSVTQSSVLERSRFPILNSAAEGLLAAVKKFQPVPQELPWVAKNFDVPIDYSLE
jgi:protein TonB